MRSQHSIRTSAYSSALCLIFVLCLTLQAQQRFVPAPHKPIPPRVEKPIKWLSPMMQRSMVGGLWMTDPNRSASIYIRNIVETDPIAVTPILHLSNGAKYVLSDVTVKPTDVAIISINDELQKKGISPFATLSGYLELEYIWPWDPFCATIRNVDVVHSLIFTYSLRPTLPLPLNLQNFTPLAPTHILEGMWWRHERNITGFVTVANLSSRPAEATIEVTDSEGRPVRQHDVTVSPGGMKLVELPELRTMEGDQGGVRVTSSETMDNLVVNGGLEDPAVGYSAILPFAAGSVQPSPEQLTIAELGLMIGPADPMMLFPAGTTFTPYSIVRNISDSPVSVTATLWWMEGGQPRTASLPAIHSAPYETQSIDVPSLLLHFGPQNFNGSFNIVFEGQARPGALLLASGSVDQTGNYVFEVMPRAVAEGASKSFQQWSTNNGDDTMFTVWNPADEAQNLNLTLFFEGGHYDFPLHMQPRETRGFNVSEIISNQIPDTEGNLIPASVRQGTARLGGSRGENEHVLIAADSGIYNVRKATCNNNCQVCDGYASVAVIPNQFTIGVGKTTGLTFMATWGNGKQDNVTSGASWASSAPSVATVSTGTVTGQSPGTAIITAAVFWVPVQASHPPGSILCTGPNPCPTENFSVSSTGTVTPPPAITAITPGTGVIGNVVAVTISGSNFGTSPTITTTGNISITNVVVNQGGTTVTATFNISSLASTGGFPVVVTNTGGQAQTTFYITKSCSPSVISPSKTFVCDGMTVHQAQLILAGVDEQNVTNEIVSVSNSSELNISPQGQPYPYTSGCVTGQICYSQNYIGYLKPGSTFTWSVQIFCSGSAVASQTDVVAEAINCQ